MKDLTSSMRCTNMLWEDFILLQNSCKGPSDLGKMVYGPPYVIWALEAAAGECALHAFYRASLNEMRVRALDMAHEFPHCDVTGVDLVLPKTQR
jgi:hypothetical protein